MWLIKKKKIKILNNYLIKKLKITERTDCSSGQSTSSEGSDVFYGRAAGTDHEEDAVLDE